MSTTDFFGIDSHKLHLHPRRVADWQEGLPITPIYMELSPAGACNHRCVFCSHDFKGYKTDYIPTQLLVRQVAEMGRCGVKALMFAGDGEPFLHKNMAEITLASVQAGLDVSFTTNGVMLMPHVAERILPVTSWIKVSCNAGTPSGYARIHRTREKDFVRVVKNLETAASIRARTGSTCTLGMQLLLLPENRDEVVFLARIAREIGMDYLVIKPYSQHPLSHTHQYQGITYSGVQELADALAGESTSSFKVICRTQTMQRIEEGAPYTHCLALPFWMYVDAQCNVWGCSRHMGDDNFHYGNLLSSSFSEILNSEATRQKQRLCAEQFSMEGCRAGCRMDAINRYLHQLRHPHPHINFI